MPLCRYFAFVGGLLLALILLIDWYAPQTATEATAASVDRTTIRIHSTHKWPSAVVFDTTQPTITPVPQPVLAEVAPVRSPPRPAREALAMAQDSDVPAAAAAAPHAPAKRVKHSTRVRRTPAARVASYDAFAFRPLFQSDW